MSSFQSYGTSKPRDEQPKDKDKDSVLEVKDSEHSKNKFIIFTSRELSKTELEHLEYHGKVLQWTSKLANESVANLNGQFILFNMCQASTRIFVSQSRQQLLCFDHCFVKQFHENRSNLIWGKEVVGDQEKQFSVISKILSTETNIEVKFLFFYNIFQDFIFYKIFIKKDIK